jgi:hypothetical protein
MGLRPLLVVALAAGAGWLLFRGIVRRRVPWIGLAVLAFPLVFLGWTERQWASAEHEFTAVSRTLVASSPGIHCQRLGETFTSAGSELGHVTYDEKGMPDGPAMLSYETCNRLAAFWRASDAGKATAPLEQVIAMHVLTHETMHIAGYEEEAEAECHALQADGRVARALGASPATAAKVVKRYLIQVYPDMPEPYTSTDCRQGGRFDESPHDGVWP